MVPRGECAAVGDTVAGARFTSETRPLLLRPEARHLSLELLLKRLTLELHARDRLVELTRRSFLLSSASTSLAATISGHTPPALERTTKSLPYTALKVAEVVIESVDGWSPAHAVKELVAGPVRAGACRRGSSRCGPA